MSAEQTAEAGTVRKIATHDGAFHCDEVLACHMLSNHVSAYRNATIVRTRDAAILETADIVVDVGARYDVASHLYDHHQRGFAHAFATEGKRSRTKLSSAGLIYKHFGAEVIGSVLRARDVKEISEADSTSVYNKVYDCFMEAVDAIDNGISMFDSEEVPRYESSTDLSSRVGRLNADWHESNPDQDANFRKAMLVAGAEFDDCVHHVATSWLPARTLIEKAYVNRLADEASGCIMVIREWAPWKDHLYTLEQEAEMNKKNGAVDGDDGGHAVGGAVSDKVLYVVYEDVTGMSWRVQCVPVRKGSFVSRKGLPERWRGRRDAELSELTGIDGCVFVHASGFIGGNKTFEGAMALAKASLQMEQ